MGHQPFDERPAAEQAVIAYALGLGNQQAMVDRHKTSLAAFRYARNSMTEAGLLYDTGELTGRGREIVPAMLWNEANCGLKEEVKRLGNQPSGPKMLFDQLRLHPKIIGVGRALFMDGYFAQAIFEAYKAVNNEVKRVPGLESKDGRDLMAAAFNERNPVIRLNPLRSESDRNEQEGFKFIFMGAITGIRNPKAHEYIDQRDPYKTLEYLGLASLLLKRLDEAQQSTSS